MDSAAAPPAAQGPRGGPGGLAPLALVLALTLGALAAGAEALRQFHISRIEAAAAGVDTLAPPQALARLEQAERACDGACGPRALVAGGAARALMASRLAMGPPRAALAAQASAMLRAAIAEQPQSGERWAWLAVSEGLTPGDDHHRAALNALQRSYHLAPFLRDLAVWRARFSGGDWAELDSVSRERSLDEVARLSLIDPAQSQVAEDAFSDPAPALALDLRMARRGELMH